MRRLLLALLAMASTPCAAQVRTLVEPRAGSAEAEVFFLNETQEPQQFRTPDTVSAPDRDGRAGRFFRGTAATSILVPAGGYVKLVYRAQPAEDVQSVKAAEPEVSPILPELSGGTASQGLLSHLEAHEPLYILYGGEPDQTKIQFSFAVPMFDIGPGKVRFAYSQTMLWGTELPSGPFTATTYSPQGFYTLPVRLGQVPLDLSVGVTHDSTGEARARSRDVNRLFARVAMEAPLGDGWSLQAAPSAYVYVLSDGLGADDIADYWGNAAITIALEQEAGFKLSAFLRGSLESRRGAAEINASYPMRAVGRWLPPLYFFGQLFTGYGESLLRYNEERTRLRFGIAFTR